MHIMFPWKGRYNKSLMNIRNNVTDNTAPCGTPDLTIIHLL